MAIVDGRFRKRKENFRCEVCGFEVKGTGFTDHCPNCLYSKHVDINPGDRKSHCGGIMKPVRTEHTRNGYIIFYKCGKCGFGHKVHAAENDNEEGLTKLML